MYYISRARLKPANKQFTSVKNDYEMTFSSETDVTEVCAFSVISHTTPSSFQCFEATSNIPTMSFDFTSIADLEKLTKDTIIGE